MARGKPSGRGRDSGRGRAGARGAHASGPTSRGTKRGVSASTPNPKRVRAEREYDSDELAALTEDAQAMASDGDEVPTLPFLSKTRLPDVVSAGAQGKERARLADDKKRQRRALQALQAQQPEPGNLSDVSTDMEGASDASEFGSDLEELPSDAEDVGASDLEDAYLHQAAKRDKREARALDKARESMATRRLPVRGEDGAIAELDPGSEPEQEASRVVFRDSDESEDEPERRPTGPTTSAVHSTRFGMRAPYDIICDAQSRSPATLAAALAMARDQIAHLASQIIGDPELGIHWLRRLLVFANVRAEAPPGEQGKPMVPVHVYIRQLAILSLLAVFVDILPGYRIRALTEQEQKEKVSQDVGRRRDWEQSIVRVYREYLEVCEAEIRGSTPLAPIALRGFCTLLMRASHFNYRKNLLACVLSQLSRRGWTEASEQCYEAVVSLLRHDTDGEVSLETVMLLYRMVRERKLAVHANVLDILAHLRLREELSKSHRTGPMGSASVAKPKAKPRVSGADSRRAKPKDVRKGLATHASKRQVKTNRELRGIEAEMREAEASVDVEERARNQSETIKLVFALYFRILKTPAIPQQLLAAALEGIVLYAHHVSLDFFRDLIQVLRVALREAMADVDEANGTAQDDLRASPRHVGMRAALFVIVTAFELLRGQGDALEIDIADFYVALYQLLFPLSMSTCLEEEAAVPAAPTAPVNRGRTPGLRRWSESALVFHALDVGFVKTTRQSVYMTIDRTAAILKRLLTSALHWPTVSTLKGLQIAHTILARTATVDSRFEALIDNRESVRDGQHDPYASIPEGARVLPSGEAAYELFLLSQTHANAQVRESALRLLSWKR